MKKFLVLVACVALIGAFTANAQCLPDLFCHASISAYFDLGYGPNPDPCQVVPCNATDVFTAHFWTWDNNGDGLVGYNITNDTSYVLDWGANQGVYLMGNWSNYAVPASVTRCHNPDYEPTVVAASWQDTVASASRNAYFYVVGTAYYSAQSRYEYDQTGLVLPGESYPYVTGMSNPDTTVVGEISLDITWNATTTDNRQVAEITSPMIAGYQFFYQEVADTANAPTTGAIAGWTPVTAVNGAATSYVAGQATSSATVTVPDPGTNVGYIAMRPVFSDGVNDIATTPAGLPTLPMVGGNGVAAYSGPSAAKVAAFTASVDETGTISLDWRTGSETEFSGFNVYRSVDGVNYEKINNSLIIAKGIAGSGASYAFTDKIDSNLRSKRAVRSARVTKRSAKVISASYKLELVNEDGTTSFVSATTLDMSNANIAR